MDMLTHLECVMNIQIDKINQRKEINEFIDELNDYINEENIFLYYYRDRINDLDFIKKTLKNEYNQIDKILGIGFFNKLFNNKFNYRNRKILCDLEIEKLKNKKKIIKEKIKEIRNEKAINENYLIEIEKDIYKLKKIKREKIKERYNL